MTYQQTIDYLFSQLPMYQRIGKAAYKADLDTTVAMAKLLGNPEKKFKSIHVAGTNGKGSVSHMLASILQEAGFKVGLYTSPHLKDFRERVKINGAMIPESAVVDFVEGHQVLFTQLSLSFFEWTVGLAFAYFAQEVVDIAVVEVGMGGRLDSTNIVQPEVAVITNIGMDHTQYLGNELPQIAKEKAGIMKKGVPTVVGQTQEEVKAVFQERANELPCPLRFADTEEEQFQFSSDLKGHYQEHNKTTVYGVVKELNRLGWNLESRALKEGFLNVVSNTGLLGRWQQLHRSPLVICDTAHNKEGLQFTMKQLTAQPHSNLHMVFGVVNDKSLAPILSLLPRKAQYYFCAPAISRALPAEELATLAKEHQLVGKAFESVKSAYNQALKAAGVDDLIYIGGSTFVVAEVV
jgi:dihydrofolate synthase/folylpolyglutamate synthase